MLKYEIINSIGEFFGTAFFLFLGKYTAVQNKLHKNKEKF